MPTDGGIKENGLSRRAAVAASLGALIVPRHVLGGPGYQAPSDTLTIMAVGVGGMGRGYLRSMKGERIAAMCDLDPEGYAARAFRAFPQAKMYRDYREMFDKEKDADVVVMAVPDHSHAMVLMEALRRRKNIYCAKPMTHTLHELRTVLAAEREAKVVTQVSVQTCASEDSCTTAEILMSGAIGPVQEVHLWTDHPWEPAAMRRPVETPPVPRGLDWDQWIGPAPYRPYHPIYHPWNWRAWWDFGEGTVGDMACHLTHVAYTALKLVPPTVVEGRRSTMREGVFRLTPDDRDILPSPIETPESESYSSMVTWDIPEREEMPPVRVHWYDGGLRPARQAWNGSEEAHARGGRHVCRLKGRVAHRRPWTLLAFPREPVPRLCASSEDAAALHRPLPRIHRSGQGRKTDELSVFVRRQAG